MHGYQTFDGFDFYYDGVRDDQIKTVSAVESYSFVKDRQRYFQGEGEIP
jgi:hypothetical protein